MADFWWEAGGGDAECTRAYRAHAAYWYRKAIENGSLPGLTKALAEKRIAEAEKELDAAEAAPQGVTEPKVAAVKRDPSQPPPKTLKLGNGADVEFVGCPAGSFMMGKEGDDNPRSIYRYHKVNITRPFWLSKYKVTHGMWNAYRKVTLTKEDHALGGMKRVHCVRPVEAEAFCEWMTKRFHSSLPKGYVVRLPTEAEWEYALKANVAVPDDPYIRIWDKRSYCYRMLKDGVAFLAFPEVKDYLVVWSLDIKPRLKAAGLWTAESDETERQVCKRGGDWEKLLNIYGTEVGTKKPNVWGLFDMLGNLGELTLDVVDASRIPSGDGGRKKWEDQEAISYEEVETDPLRRTPQNIRGKNLFRGGHINFGWGVNPYAKNLDYVIHPFRLCVGPDLMKEKGFKK